MRQLREIGMRTVSFSSFAERHGAWHWYAGFQEIHDTGHFGHEIADHVTPGVLDWLRANGAADNWFLHVNLWDVHVPYRTPENIGNRFAHEPLSDQWLTQEMLDAHRSQPGIRSARDALFLAHALKRPDLNPASLENMTDVKRMTDGYDTAVNYMDEHVGRLLAALGDLGILDETAVIISADHGECLGELNAYGGHCFADACTARVPLIVRWPGVTDFAAGKCHRGLYYAMDLAPTVLELLGASVPDVWDARSMAAAWRGEPEPGRNCLILSQLAQTCQRSVVFQSAGDEHLYIHTLRSGFYDLPSELLFNIARDPHETRDLAGSRPDLMEKAAAMLMAWRGKILGAAPHADPAATVLSEPDAVDVTDYIKRLRKSGRGEWVQPVIERAAKEQRLHV